MTVDDRDRAGRTPLHYAAIDPPHDLPHIAAQTDPALAAENDRKAGEYKVANTRRLLEAGAEVNAADDNGSTPLHFAANGDSVEVIRLLLDAGAHVNAVNTAGDTPIYIAIRNTTPAASDIQALLLKYGADPTIANEKGASTVRFVQRYGTDAMKAVFADFL